MKVSHLSREINSLSKADWLVNKKYVISSKPKLTTKSKEA